MIDSSNRVPVRAPTGEEDEHKKLYVESHTTNDNMVALRITGYFTLYVLASDLSVAITNATNTGR